MIDLPARYAFLAKEPGPHLLTEAVKLYGIHEAPGGANNPVILAWAHELKLKDYKSDETPWCGLFMAIVAERAGEVWPTAPLWARNWKDFGVAASPPMLADVLVFQRPGGGGHVGMYVGEDNDAFHVLGGNEGDAVNIVRMARNRVIATRRPAYAEQPANVRVIRMGSTGPLSTNEA